MPFAFILTVPERQRNGLCYSGAKPEKPDDNVHRRVSCTNIVHGSVALHGAGDTGLANYYSRFMEGYAKVAAPLPALGSPRPSPRSRCSASLTRIVGPC
jgi:hypothetical protein